MATRVIELDRVLDVDELAATHAAVRAVARYEMLANQAVSEGFAAGLLGRHDAAREFLRTGGLSRRPVDLRTLADRSNFFRATLAYESRILQPGIEAYLRSPRLAAAARELYDAAIVEPAIVFVNLAVPGQEIGLHTDVPEFHGFDRERAPEWLLVVMQHSGLFRAERVAIATGVSWFGEAKGGEFVCWPEGREGSAKTVTIADDRGVVLDTDSVFHAVAPVAWTRGSERPLVEVGAQMRWEPARGAWVVSQRGVELIALAPEDVRISISWKAWCFADADERARLRGREGALELAAVLTRLRRDLAERGRLPSAEAPMSDAELALLMIDEYVRFPSLPS